MSLKNYYFTFGQNHIHPLTGESMKDYYIKLKGTYNSTREIMLSIFGLKWSMQYNEKDFLPNLSIFPKGEY